MGILRDAGWQPLDDDGAIMSGAKAYWYETGASTTPKDTYSNKALSSANANPVEADSNGRFGAIFGDEDGGYRLVLKTSAGVTIYTKDEQFAKAIALDELTRRREIVRSPFDHGAVGDGSTDDATALAAAIAAADGILDLEGKTYRCDSTLALRSGITIRNGTLDFSNASISAGLQGAGTAEASPRTFVTASDNALGTVSSVAGLSAGDLVRIRSSDVVTGSHKYAEMFLVESTATGPNVIYLDGKPIGTYTTSPYVEEITAVQDIRLENLTIKAPGTSSYGIYLDLCQRVHLVNVRVTGVGAENGMRITNCRDVVLSACVLSKSTADEGPAIHIGDASSYVTLSRCRIEGALIAIDIGDNYGSHHGLSKDVRVSDCDIDWCGGVVFNDGASNCIIEDCTLNLDIAPSGGTQAGVLVGGSDIIVRNNSIRWAQGNSGREAIDIAMTTCDSVAIIGNRIIGDASATGTSIQFTSGTVKSVRIVDNEIHEIAAKYIDIVDGTIVNCEISGNECRAGVGSAMVAIDLTPATGTITSLTVDRNYIDCSTGYTTGISHADSSCTDVLFRDNVIKCAAAGGTQTGIDASTVAPTYLIADGNHITGAGTGINAGSATSSFTRISNNTIALSSAAGATACIICNHNNAVISGNICTSSGGVGKGVDVNGGTLSSISIIGNVIATDDTGVEVSGTLTGIIIANNNILVTSASATVYVCAVDPADAGATSYVTISGNMMRRNADDGINTILRDIDGITVNGNVIVNGTYGLDIDAGSTEAIHDGNVFTDQSTGTVNGTFDTTGDSA